MGNDNFQSPNLFEFDEDQYLADSPFDGECRLQPNSRSDHRSKPLRLGTVNFDSDILGIITTTNDLAASDFLANTGVNYLNPGNPDLEAGDSGTMSGPR